MARTLRRCALALALVVLMPSAAPLRAAGEALDVVDVRVGGFPRVVVRLNARLDGEQPSAKLTSANLRVVEDGQPQPSADLFQVRSPEVPASVVLAVDVSGSMAEQDKLRQAKEAAKGFLAQIRPRDRVALISFASDVAVRQPFASDRPTLIRAIDGLATVGNTRLYDALVRSVQQVAPVSGGTRAVIVLTDGEDTESAASVDEGIGQATRAGVPIYTIGLGADARADVLQRIAAETGGRSYRAPGPGDLAEVFRLISRQLASQYEVFWVSRTRGEPGREVPVQIQLSGPGLPGGEASFTYRMPGAAQLQPLPVNASQTLGLLPGAAPPSEEQILMAGLLAGLAVALLYAGLLYRSARRRLQARLSTYLADGGTPTVRPVAGGALSSSTRRVSMMPLTAASAGIAARLLPPAYAERLRRQLIQAGFLTARHFQLFLASMVALPFVLGAGGYVLLQLKAGSQTPLFVRMALMAALVGLGFYLPHLWLHRRVRQRRHALSRALPDALDLMTIGVSAGLSLDGAMLEIVQKWDNELSREFGLVLNEMRMGASRRAALEHLVERTQLEDIRLLVASLIQADELGTGVADTLKIQAEQLRIRRRQQAEEAARKAPIKMLFPLVFLIFPALFVVILAPAILDILRMLRSLV